ncbi:adenosylcobinamide-GDP ribazoletransferase [Vibrio ziniensis]|uniref:Adenosylcobinamide-GDP ribazoletransferase n=1 Tax=Vibrio ziniensis TaxID=2711221 RepID=A0A6G7CHE3_9VIBR|nr:adenosylcobinamide-GDP ribazoletransferase [Vibrio ziniensis]QIH41571.1 adenosylcobinamide-GDP ribazoletransferase [Vibrio ziniensis]
MLAKLKYQFELFLLALSFFSRVPVPANLPYSSERMNQSGRYFALVGILLGSLCAGFYACAELLLTPEISIFLTMVLSLMLTGAFHEDGLADMADGIGGGMTVERRLTIMKDSRIGTYGSSALIMALLGKYVLLTAISNFISLIPVWLVGYTLSRSVASSFIFNTPYVSDSDTSKSKPLAHKQSYSELAVVIITGLIPCVLLDGYLTLVLISAAFLFRQLFKRWLISRLGGFTGDCLGAAQQLMELTIYLVIVIFAQNGLPVMGVAW